VIGGNRAQAGFGDLAQIQFADQGDNGVLQDWQDATDMSGPAQASGAGMFKNWVYVFGGQASSNFLDTVNRGDLDQIDGIKNWTAMPNLNEPRSALSYADWKGWLFAIGGKNQGNSGEVRLKSVETAGIMPDGTIQSWTYAPPLKNARAGASAVVYMGKIYVIGGFDGTNFLSSVEISTVHSQRP